MEPEQTPTKRLEQIKQTAKVSWKMLDLVWQVDHLLFLGSVITTILPAIIPFVNFYIYKLIIDLVVAVVAQGAVLDTNQLYLLIGLRVLTYFVLDASFRTQELMERLFWTKVPIHLNEKIFNKTANLDIQYFEDSKFKDLLEKVRDSVSWRPQQLISYLLMGVQSFVQVTIAFVAIANLNPFLVLLIASVSLPEFINQTQQSKLSWGIWERNSPFRKKFWYLSGLLQHAWTIKEVKIFRLAKNFLDEIRSIQERFYVDNAKLSKRYYGINIIFNILSTTVFIGFEIYVIFEALARRISIGDVNFYTGVVSNFQSGLSGLFRNMTGVFENSLYVKSMFDILEAEPKVKQAENPQKVTFKKAPLIEFRNITFAYPDSKQKILKNFSLTIKPGEKIALVGENGAGKSTLIKLLVRFYDVSEGGIFIDGINLKDLELDDWYRHVGVLFQDFNKYEHTVTENISFGKAFEEIDTGEIIRAATSAGANSMIQRLDKGYEQMLGKTFEGGVDLSIGQWQKIALARAFLRSAPVLILDEPTASIDAKAESEIFNRVERLSKDKTVIIISHRFSTVRNADKIYIIENGKITESGDHQGLMKEKGQYATLFNLQAKGYQ